MNTIEEPRIAAGQFLHKTLLGAAGSGVLFSASLAVPLVGFAAGFMAAVPLCYTRLAANRKAALLATLIAAVLISLSFKPLIGVWYLAQCGLIGLLVPDFVLRGMHGTRALLWTTAIASAATALVAFTLAASAGQDLLAMAKREIATGMEQALKLYEQQQGMSSQDLATIKQAMQTVATTLVRIFPALTTLNLLLVASVSLLFVRRMALSRGLALNIAPFTEFRVPESLIWLLIAAGFGLLTKTTLVTTPALNILAVLSALYFCQGLAVLLTFAGRTAYAGILKVMLAIMLLVQPYLLPVVVFLGIFDLWGDFRSPRTKQKENL